MATTAVVPNPGMDSHAPDDLDRLLDYDDAVEDFLRDMPLGNDQNNASTTEQAPVDDDQEVQVKKKRKPMPKLDENRLLSAQGIPRLRKITKTRLKFRGKGHEFTDMSRLLNTYQLWLDDLYPRAKFRDALAMVEKVGHSKRMQVMRRAWLDETKPGRGADSADVEMSGGLEDVQDGDGAHNGAQPSAEELFQQMLQEDAEQHASDRTNPGQDAPGDDELDALLAESGSNGVTQTSRPAAKSTVLFNEDDSDGDELDALLAESGGKEIPDHGKTALAASNVHHDAPEEDDLDALLAEQDSAATDNSNTSETIAKAQDVERDFAEEEEVMAGMDDDW